MEFKQTDTTMGKRIRFLRQQSEMTQDELAKELNVTRQALSNWERDINGPDVNILKKICCIFGIQMDDLVKGAMKMEAMEKNENDTKQRVHNENNYRVAIALFYGVGLFLGACIILVGGLVTMTARGWLISFIIGGIFFLVFGMLANAIIMLKEPKER